MEEHIVSVLLVEDDPDDAFLLRKMLEEAAPHHFHLTHATRLEEGLAAAAGDRFEVALLDLSLPDSHGVETFSRFHEAQPGMAAVVLTGLDDETVAMTAVHGGAQDYLVKGQVNGSLLVRSLRYAIERQRTSHYRALLTERERFVNAVAEMSDGIVVTDENWRLLSANRAASLLLNLSPEGVVDTPLAQALAAFSLSQPLADLQASPERFTAFEVSRSDTHPPLYVDARLSRLFDANGKLASAVLTLRDVTDERLARHVQANFMTTVPHKLRTPLALLGGYLELAKRMPPERLAREWPHVSEVCESEIAQLSAIVQKLLDFEALSTWQLAEELRHTDVAAVAAEVAEKVRDRYPERPFAFVVEIAPAAGQVDATAEHLGFILDELMDNAVKFGDKEPVQVALHVGREDELTLRFEVTDNGPGIPHEYYDRIFEGFIQVEEHVTGQVPGLGVGLRLARQVIGACGGEITVNSRLGEGTTFAFTLPAPPN